jgi:hypothetical protein
MGIKTIQEYIQRVPGPWYVTLGAAQIGKSLKDPNYGSVQFLVSDIKILEEGSLISFINFNGTSRMDIITGALYNPQFPDEESLIFNYLNAVVPLGDQEMENWPVWMLFIEKFNPIANIVQRKRN